ncbi:MAG TPA: Uma2 family endonuclease [Caulifigura sp.]|jgi:Uma2 family endonuclease|nr:Uma2 family endonuclease [Caulifigura sp.]
MLSVLDDVESVLEIEPDAIKRLTADMNGMSMTVEEFRAAEEGEPGYRFDLIHGVLVVSPAPSAGERDPNGELEFRLRLYRRTHPQGSSLDLTLFEQELETSAGIRRADRVIWAGLGRKPDLDRDVPAIVVEFVSGTSRDRRRDYEEKRSEYIALGVKEYWIIDRFRRTMTVCVGAEKPRIVRVKDIYSTPILPGFELPLAELFAITDSWAD